MKKIHVVNHTHWDREWYFTAVDAVLLSDNTFSNVISELKSNPESRFVLDGQSSILDEFLEKRPEKISDVKMLVKNKQLFIGPWYTQSDSFFVNEESFIRNLTIGIRDARRYGQEMKVGYLPDTFGFNAQMPTILANCGFDNIVFWRGINFNTQVSGPYFKWNGLGSKQITAVNLVDGYGTAAFLSDDKEYVDERLIPAVKKIEELTDSDDLVIPAGGDQLEIIHNLPQILRNISNNTNYQFLSSSYEEFISIIKGKKNLPEYTGEFRESCSARVHKSIGSVRYNIKHLNYSIEQKLLKRVEPLISIAEHYNISISHEFVIDAWKKILQGQAHDSIGGCVSDNVAVDILHRMKEADEIADGVENYIVKRLNEKLGLNSNQIIVFNTTSKKFSGYKMIDFLNPDKNIKLKGIKQSVITSFEYFSGKNNLLLETPEGPKYVNEAPYYRLHILAKVNVPSMGFKVFDIEKDNTQLESIECSDNKFIENEFYKISYKDSKLSIAGSDGREIRDFLKFEDMANAGDTYDFSPLSGDKVIEFLPNNISVSKSSLVEQMVMSGSVSLPYSLDDRLSDSGIQKNYEIELTINIRKNENFVRCHVSVNNNVLSHRLRVKLNVGIGSNKSIASLPFGFIERNARTKPIENWYKNYVEYPIDIEPFDKSVSQVGESKNLTLYGKGLKEYQIVNDDLYITLFATTSQLGKPNLTYRPGRASGDTTKKGHVMMPTPMAEIQGKLNFDFALQINDGVFDEYAVSKTWKEYSDQSICYQEQELNKFIYRLDNKIQPVNTKQYNDREFSLLEVCTEAFDSSFGVSMYDNDAYLLRLSNPTGSQIKLNDIFLDKLGRYEFVDCQEQHIKSVNYIDPYDLITIKVWK